MESIKRDELSIEGICSFLGNSNYKDRIYLFQSLESTNDTALKMAAEGAAHGTVVLADGQTAGRGRRERSFFSPPKHGIYMSIILHSGKLAFSPHTLVTAFTAVAVCEAIEAVKVVDIKPQIKWVNDIYLKDKKICGILAERLCDVTIVGIGINFIKPLEGYPSELSSKVGSLFESGNVPITRNQLIADIINRLSCYRTQHQIHAAYKARLMMLGKRVMVHTPNENFIATVLDIDKNGALIVCKATDQILTLISGEISITTV